MVMPLVGVDVDPMKMGVETPSALNASQDQSAVLTLASDLGRSRSRGDAASTPPEAPTVEMAFSTIGAEATGRAFVTLFLI
jgi:hypothetical protein